MPLVRLDSLTPVTMPLSSGCPRQSLDEQEMNRRGVLG